MKSIALTLAVLFGALSFAAQANTTKPADEPKDGVVLEEVAETEEGDETQKETPEQK